MIEMLVDLYLLVLSRGCLKVISILAFGELSMHYFNFEINIFVGLYKKYNVWRVYKIKNKLDSLEL